MIGTMKRCFYSWAFNVYLNLDTDTIKTTPKDPLQGSIRPIIILREKKLKYTFNELIQNI
jgi:hypothetical protein